MQTMPAVMTMVTMKAMPPAESMADPHSVSITTHLQPHCSPPWMNEQQ
jgi:hypothetical protein